MIIGITGHRPHRIKLGELDATNPYVAWRLKQLATAYLKHYAPELVNIGMAQGFDMVAAEACIELGIPFMAHLPFTGYDAQWPVPIQIHCAELLKKADMVNVVSDKNETKAYLIRDEAIVNASDMMLAMWDGNDYGGTYYTLSHAHNLNKPITNLWKVWQERGNAPFPFSTLQNSPIEYDGQTFPTFMHYYQAMKTADKTIREEIINQPVKEVYSFAVKNVEPRDNWNDIKERVIEVGLEKKYRGNTQYARALLQSEQAEIVYWNTWHDITLGKCYCSKCRGAGENLLGEGLMRLRAKLQDETDAIP